MSKIEARYVLLLHQMRDLIFSGEVVAGDKVLTRNDYCGLCSNWVDLLYALGVRRTPNDSVDPLSFMQVFGSIVETWPKYTGNSDYPVPATDDEILALRSPGEAGMWMYEHTDQMYEAEYGDLRKELLQYVLDQI